MVPEGAPVLIDHVAPLLSSAEKRVFARLLLCGADGIDGPASCLILRPTLFLQRLALGADLFEPTWDPIRCCRRGLAGVRAYLFSDLRYIRGLRVAGEWDVERVYQQQGCP